VNFLTESLSAWEQIEKAASHNQPIVIYGTGNGADKIVDFCDSKHIALAGIYASDGFCRGKTFRGIKVESYLDITSRLGNNFLLIIGFASELPDVLNRFKELNNVHPTFAPHLGLYCEEVLNQQWLQQYDKELQAVYTLLADELSRQVFRDLLNYKFSGKLHYLFDHATRRQDDLQLLQLSNQETYFDLGAYDGDTVQEFLQTVNNHFTSMVAVEPDAKNYTKLQHFIKDIHFPNISAIQSAIWSNIGNITFSNQGGRAAHVSTDKKSQSIPATTIDHIVAEYKQIPSYIKMDLEGCEKAALQGGASTITNYKPKLLLAGYHYNEDLFRIPLMLRELRPDYKIFLRKHPYVPDWEINFFAI